MFIEEYPQAVPLALCEEIIAAFEADPTKKPSTVVLGGIAKVSGARTGTRVKLNSEGWSPLVKAVLPALTQTMNLYVAKYPGLQDVVKSESLTLMGPVMERVEPGQGFNWHRDHSAANWQRVVAGLLYLRTIDDGGATEFADQAQAIKSEAGKIALFPPYWTHYHRGVSPGSQVKYVMSYFWAYPPSPPPPAG
jgi:hypothetical protein